MTTTDTPLDLDAIQPWIAACGACDAGIGTCTHPAGDYRPVMLNLITEVERLRAHIDEQDDELSTLRRDLDTMTVTAFANQAEANRLRAERDAAQHGQARVSAKRAANLVFEALGAASVCWETPGGAGEFLSERAAAIGAELLAALGFEVPEGYRLDRERAR